MTPAFDPADRPPLAELEALAASRSGSWAGARWISLQVAMHVLNAVDRRDPRSGESLPQSLLGCLGAIEATTLDATRPLPSDRLAHAVELALGPLESIVRAARTKVIREHRRLPIHQAREMDSKSFDAFGQMPGRTYREKCSGPSKVLGVVRVFTPDTHENRVVRRFARVLGQLLEGRVVAIEEGAYDPTGPADASDRLARCWKLCRDVVPRSALADVPASLSPTPNQVLLRDRDYSRVWRAWLWLRAYEEDVNRTWLDLEHRFRIAAFWMLAAHLAMLPGIEVAEDLTRVAPGFGGSRYGLDRLGAEVDPSRPVEVEASLTLLVTSGRDLAGAWPQPGLGHRSARSYRVRLTLEGDSIAIQSTPLEGKTVLVDGSRPGPRDLDEPRITRYRLAIDELVPPRARRGAPFTWIRVPAASGPRFRDHADLRGMRRFVSIASKEVLWDLGVPVGEEDGSPPCPAPTRVATPPEPPRRIGLDLGSSLARFDADGRRGVATTALHATRHDDPRQYSGCEWRSGRHDRRGDPTAPGTETVAIADILDPETEVDQEVLSTAARRIFEDLRAELAGSTGALPHDARLAFAVPDGLDEFSQRILRSAAAGSFGHAYPVWRSVATLLGWQQTSGFAESKVGEGDVVVVFDAGAGAMAATFLVARWSEPLAEAFPPSLGIYWERRPSLSRRSHAPDLRRLADDLGFPRLLAEHLRRELQTDPNASALPPEMLDRIIDRLVREGAVEASACDARPLWLPVEGAPGIEALHLAADSSGVARLLDEWLDSFRRYLAAMAMDLTFMGLLDELKQDGGKIVFLLAGRPAGLPVARRWIMQRDLPEAFRGIRTWTCPNSSGFVASGARDFLDRAALGLPGWHDWLPDLYLDVASDGLLHELQLLHESQAAATLGEVIRHEVPERLVLPAGQASYRFPLLSGRSREPLPYDASIVSDRFPLAEDAEARLVLTYRYGLDNAYELTVIPDDPSRSPFPTLSAQWAHRPKPLSAAPTFPTSRPWDGYPDLIAKQEWFVSQSRKFVDRCEGLFPDLPEAAERLRYHEQDWKTGRWLSFSDWMRRGLETPMRICWDEGRVLDDAPEDMVEAAESGFLDWLLNLAGLRDDRLGEDIRRDRRLQPEIRHVRNHALWLLGRLHRDAPQGVAELMVADLENASYKALRYGQDGVLHDPLDHIKFLLGDGEGPRAHSLPVLAELASSYLLDRPRAPLVHVEILRVFSVALWRNEQFVHSLARELPRRGVALLLDSVQNVYEGLGDDPRSTLEIRLFVFGAQVVLGLLRLRATPEYQGLLAAGSPGLVRIAREVRRLDRAFAEAGVDVWSNVQFDLNRPQALWRMSILAYALNCYLTGDSGSGLIGISSIGEEPRGEP